MPINTPEPMAVDKMTAAALLSISPRTIDRLRESGRLRAVTVRAVQTRDCRPCGGPGKILFAVDELRRFLAGDAPQTERAIGGNRHE